MITEDCINRIRDSTDILSFVQQYVQLRKAGRLFRGLCPFHLERDGSFTIYKDKQNYKCYGCGKGGNVFGFVMDYFSVDFPEAVEILSRHTGIELEYTNSNYRREASRKKDIRAALEEASKFFQRNLRGSAAEEYVRGQRGLNDSTIKHFGVGYAPNSWNQLYDHMSRLNFDLNTLNDASLVSESQRERGRYFDFFRDRVIITLKDSLGRVIGFTGRSLSDEEPAKYLNSRESSVFSKGRTFFGFDDGLAREVHELGEIIVVEGNFDVMLPWQEGYRNLVATSGTALTEDHARILQKRFPGARTILAYDRDEGGIRGAMSGGKVLAERTGSYICLFPEGKDPDDLVREGEDLGKFFERAIPFSEFYFNQVGEKFDMRSFEGQRRFLQEVSTDFYSRIPASDRRLFVEHLISTTGIEKESVLDFFVEKESAETNERKDLESRLLGYFWGMDGESVRNLISFDPRFRPAFFSSDAARLFFSYVSGDRRRFFEGALFFDKQKEDVLKDLKTFAWDNRITVSEKDLENIVERASHFVGFSPSFNDVRQTYVYWRLSALKNGNILRLAERAILAGKSPSEILDKISEAFEG